MTAKEYKQDCISVKGIDSYTKIGVADNERAIGQNLRFDLEVYLDLGKAGKSDDLRDTVSYIELVKVVIQVSQGREFKLLEHLATCLSDKIFQRFDKVQALSIRVYKPHIPNPEFKGQPSVFIFRSR